MTFLGFHCIEYFKTSGSISFDLNETVPNGDCPAELAHSPLTSSVGNVEIHYPVAGHIKTYVRVFLPICVTKNVSRNDLKYAVESLLREQGIPSGVTYEADLIPYDLITRVEKRVDANGKTDGLE